MRRVLINQRLLAFSIAAAAATWSLAGLGLMTDRQNAAAITLTMALTAFGLFRRIYQLAAAKEAAEAGCRSRSAALATVSHELRMPLDGVSGTASLLLETELTPEQRKSVETIRECSDTLLGLVNDVLDFSKLESGRFDVETRAFSLNELCEAVLNIVEPRAKSKRVALAFAPSPLLPAMVCSDPIRLRQVLLNFVGNAVKFTDSGPVLLRVLPIGSDEASGRIRFEVTDTGMGISKDAQARLFTEFTQGDASIVRRCGDTGLGLAVCKKIAAAMGGQVGLVSAVGKGSTFWFELPFTAADIMPSPRAVAPPRAVGMAHTNDDASGRTASDATSFPHEMSPAAR